MPTVEAHNLAELFKLQVDLNETGPAMQVKRDGHYATVTWGDLADDVYRTAAVLAGLGLEPGDRVAQFAENRYEWIVLDMALAAVQAVHVPLHASLSAPQARYQIEHSGAKVVVISGSDQANLLAAADLPDTVSHVLSHDACAVALAGRPPVHLAEATAAVDPATGRWLLAEAARDLMAASLATILYTSGTTGEPKGVMLAHGNLVSNARAVIEPFDLTDDDVSLCLLPLSHIFARTCDIYTWLTRGGTLALAERRETVLEDIRAVSPTVFNAVPYFFEKVAAGLIAAGHADTPGALQAALGGRVRLACSGGAALPERLFDFYNDRGVLLTQGYGLTETSPVIAASGVKTNRRGSVGPPLPGVEVEIAGDGEILTRGPHVMLGYWQDQPATAAIMRGGWLATGDLGRLDDDGYLYITGRKKEIIVTTGGKNIAPTMIESLLTADPLIVQAMVVGDGRKCLAALIVPEPAALGAELKRRELPLDRAGEIYRERIDACTAELARHEQIGPFTLLSRGFLPEYEEVTAKGSLRRAVIEEHFAAEIEGMYAG